MGDIKEIVVIGAILIAAVLAIIGFIAGWLSCEGKRPLKKDKARQEVLTRSQQKLEEIAIEQAENLEQDLKAAAVEANKYIKEEFNRVITNEIKQFEALMNSVRAETAKSIEQQQAQAKKQNTVLENQRKEALEEAHRIMLDAIKHLRAQAEQQDTLFKAQMAKELAKEKQRRIRVRPNGRHLYQLASLVRD